MKRIYWWLMRSMYTQLLCDVEQEIYDIKRGAKPRYESYGISNYKYDRLHGFKNIENEWLVKWSNYNDLLRKGK